MNNSDEVERIWQEYGSFYEYNRAGLLSAERKPGGQKIYYFYENDNSLRYRVDGEGGVEETEYTLFGELAILRRYSKPIKLATDETTASLTARLSHLTSLNDEVTTYDYNSNGQLVSTIQGSQGQKITTYNAFGEIATTMQNHQYLTRYYYDNRGLLKTVIDDAGSINVRRDFDYDAFGWLAEERHNGIMWQHINRNKRGEELYLYNAKKEYKVIQHDAFGRVDFETNYTHTVIAHDYEYDDVNGTLVINDYLNKTKVTTCFNAFGDRIAITDANGNKTQFTYDEQGRLTTIDGPEHSNKNYTYDAAGRLVLEQEGTHCIRYTYDAANRLLTHTVDPDGLNLLTAYGYDAIGRQIKVTRPDELITLYQYNDAGKLVSLCIDPDGLAIQTLYTYDARGLLVREEKTSAGEQPHVTAYEWDHLGRVTATIIDPDGLHLKSSHVYDAEGNVVAEIDARGNSTYFVYNELNQCHYRISATGAVIEYRYDIDGYINCTVSYATPLSPLTNYDNESLAAALVRDDVHDHYVFQYCNGQGQVLARYDALGYLTSYRYDGNGNLIEQQEFVQSVSLTALKNGERPLPTSREARSTYYLYDGLNHLRYHCTSTGQVTGSVYDKNGQLQATIRYKQQITIPSEGLSIDYIQQQLQNNVGDQCSYYAYDNAGRIIRELSTTGVLTCYKYNNQGQVIASTVSAKRVTLSSEMSLADLTVTEDELDRTTRHVYDAAGRERYRISSQGRVVERRYDSGNNVIAELIHEQLFTAPNDTLAALEEQLAGDPILKQTFYRYDQAGRLHDEINALGDTTSYEYDEAGNVLHKQEANKALWSYRYDKDNRLQETISPATQIITAQGVQTRSIITQHHYDCFGNVIEEVCDAGGINQRTGYEYDTNNRLIKKIHPQARINTAAKIPGAARQEQEVTLIEETRYNAFGDVVAQSDRAVIGLITSIPPQVFYVLKSVLTTP